MSLVNICTDRHTKRPISWATGGGLPDSPFRSRTSVVRIQGALRRKPETYVRVSGCGLTTLSSSSLGKESLIQELTERLTKLQTPGGTHTNQTFNLHFLTREAADEEKRHLLEEITRLKDLVKQRDAWLSGRDQQIVALRDESKHLFESFSSAP